MSTDSSIDPPLRPSARRVPSAGELLPAVWTGSALLLKSVLLLGLILDTDHLQLLTRAGARETWWHFPFHFGFVLLLVSATFLFGGRPRLRVLTGLNTLLSLLFICDILYYRGFSTLPTPFTLAQTANLHNLSGSIRALIGPLDWLFIVDLPVLIAFTLARPAWGRTHPRRPLLAGLLLATALMLILWQPVADVRAGKNLEFTTYSPYDTTFTCKVMSPIGYLAYSLWSAAGESHRVRLSDEDRQRIGSWFARNTEHRPDNRFKGRFTGMNLILLQVESLEGFVINRAINGQALTPRLDRLLEHGLYFRNFHEQTNEGTSSDADLMANTSVYPVRRGSSFFRFPHTTYPSLPLRLKELGYTTLAVEPDEGSFWNWVAAQKAIGFDTCLDISHFKRDEIVNLGLSDGSFLRQLAPTLLALRQPFYVMTCTLTSHTPFVLPAEYRGLTLPTALADTSLGGYFQCCHYTDRQIGEFLDTLDRAGLLEHTVVALYGDHEGIHKYMRKQVSEVQPAESWWQDNDRHVPFIIFQKQLAGEVIDTVGGQIDIFPTLAYVMGIDTARTASTVMGRNLLNTGMDFALLKEGDIRGRTGGEAQAAHIRQGLEIADSIIRGDYFKGSR